MTENRILNNRFRVLKIKITIFRPPILIECYEKVDRFSRLQDVRIFSIFRTFFTITNLLRKKIERELHFYFIHAKKVYIVYNFVSKQYAHIGTLRCSDFIFSQIKK